MTAPRYLMENKNEIERLEIKTRTSIVQGQAKWAGIKPGHRVADIGCGPGKTTAELCALVQPAGEAVGIDASAERIEHARQRYGRPRLDFVCRNFLEPLEDLGQFDFIWVRFVLEYHRTNSFDIVARLTRILKPGGILCLIDIDNNCLCHHGLPDRLARTIQAMMDILEREENFDPYVGRKLYSYLYDLDFYDIDIQLSAHHMIYGPLNRVDDYNWRSKVEVGARQLVSRFRDDYPGGFDEFLEEFNTSFPDERRFIYTPLICCRGRKR